MKCGSYRTYEEWKPTKGKNLFGACNGSYRTYEEWKLFRFRTQGLTYASSYRTYEEWKPYSPSAMRYNRF